MYIQICTYELCQYNCNTMPYLVGEKRMHTVSKIRVHCPCGHLVHIRIVLIHVQVHVHCAHMEDVQVLV